MTVRANGVACSTGPTQTAALTSDLLQAHADAVAVDSYRYALQARVIGIDAVAGACVKRPLVCSAGEQVLGVRAPRAVGLVWAPVLVGGTWPSTLHSRTLTAPGHCEHLAFPDVVERPGVQPVRHCALTLARR